MDANPKARELLAEEVGCNVDDLDSAFIQRDDALRAITRALAQQPQGWRPIESAPRDGTEFQAWVGGTWEPRCRYNEDGVFQGWGRIDYDMDGWDIFYAEPTHWMPLPPPPGGKVGG